MCVIKVTLTFFMLIGTLNGYKILAVLPNPAKSHFAVFEPLMKALARKGHELTVLSYFPQEQHVERYTDLNLGNSQNQRISVFDLGNYQGYRYEKYRTIVALARMGYETCTDALAVPSVQHLIRSNRTFDLLISEYFDTDCFLGFADIFKIPVIGISSCTMLSIFNERLGNPNNPAYIPNNLLLFSDRMSFFERVENTVFGLLQQLVWQVLVDKPSNSIVKEVFGEQTPSLEEMAYKTSIILVNSHFSLMSPRPQVPGVIDVGGMHIGKLKKLPRVRINLIFNNIIVIISRLGIDLPKIVTQKREDSAYYGIVI